MHFHVAMTCSYFVLGIGGVDRDGERLKSSGRFFAASFFQSVCLSPVA